MPEAREIAFTQEKIHDLVDQSNDHLGNYATSSLEVDISVMAFPPLTVANKTTSLLTPLTDHVDGARAQELIPSNPDIPESCCGPVKPTPAVRSRKPKWKPADEKMFSFKSYKEKSDSLKPQHGNQKTDATKPNPGKMPLLCTLDIPRSGAGSSRLNTEPQGLKPAWAILPSVVSEPEENRHNISVPKSNPRKMPLLCNPDLPSSGADLLKFNSGAKERIASWADVASVSIKPEHKVAATNKTSRKRVSFNNDIPKHQADLFILNMYTSELESEGIHFPSSLTLFEYNRKKTAAPIIDSGKMDALCDFYIPKGLGDSLKLKTCKSQLEPKKGPSLTSLSDFTTHKTADLKINSGKNKSKTAAPIIDSGKINALCNFDIPNGLDDSLKLKTSMSQLEPKNGPALSSLSEFTTHTPADLKIKSGKGGASCTLGKHTSHTDAFKLKPCSEQLEPNNENVPSVSSSSEHTNQQIENSNTIPKKIPALLDLDIPMPHPDFLKTDNCTQQFQQTDEHIPTSSSSRKQRNRKIAAQKSNPRKKTLSNQPDKVSSRDTPFKLNPQAKEYKPIQKNRPSHLSTAESVSNKQVVSASQLVMDPTIKLGESLSYADVLKQNNKVMALQPNCDNIPISYGEQNCETHSAESWNTESELSPGEPLSNADELLNPHSWMKVNSEFENAPEGSGEMSSLEERCAAREVNRQERLGATFNFFSQLEQRPSSVEGTPICANTNQNIASGSATIQSEHPTLSVQESEHPTLSVQERQAVPTAYTPVVVVNNLKQPDVMSSVSAGVNEHFVFSNTEVTSAASTLQHSQVPQEQEPRPSRMQQFLTLSIKPWFQVTDPNNVNNDSSQNSNEGRLPDTFLELRPDGGPVTPDLYQSMDEIFGWHWGPAAIPESRITGSTGQGDLWTTSVTRVDKPLQELEMSVTAFEEKVEESYKEPEFETEAMKE